MIKWILSKGPDKKKLNYKNIKNFIETYIRIIKYFFFKEEFIQSQTAWRITKGSENCLENGYCPCKCDLPDKFKETLACDNKCYPKWMSKKEWSTFISKEKLDIEEIIRQAQLKLDKYGYRTKI